MGGVHGVLAEADGVWVTCTAADLLIQVDWRGRVVADWEWRQDAALVDALGFAPLPPVDRGVDYRDPGASRGRVRDVVHLNSVARGPNGLLLSFGRVLSPDALRRRSVSRLAGRLAEAVGVRRRAATATPAVPSGTVAGSRYAVVALDGDGRSSVVRMETGTSVPNHDLWLDGDLLVTCDTNRGQLVGVDVTTQRVRHAVAIPGEPSFVRGLASLGGLRFAVGSQRPAAVYHVDLAAETVVASFPLGGHADESVHTLGVVPEVFGAPAGALFS